MIYSIRSVTYYQFLSSYIPEKYDKNNQFYYAEGHFEND